MDETTGESTDFGSILREMRQRRGMTLTQLSKEVHYSIGHLSRVERGKASPTPKIAEACDRILKADGQLAALVPADPQELGCPYPGLAPFGRRDADLFFGRDRAVADLVTELADRTGRGGPLLVTGRSGAGKSSVLRAGLVPALARGALPAPRSRDWPVEICTPGADPLGVLTALLNRHTGAAQEAIVEALRRPPASVPPPRGNALQPGDAAVPGPELVVIVDQFEEVFALCSNEEDRAIFIAALCAMAGPAPVDGLPRALVVLGMRADFYPRCLSYAGLTDALKHGHYVLRDMSVTELEKAITGPADAMELSLEPGLVKVLFRDLGVTAWHESRPDEPVPASLPMLAHALRVTWQQRNDQKLTLTGYQASGGISAAIKTSADKVYASLDEQLQSTVRRLFPQLVAIGPGPQETRRRVPLDRLVEYVPSRETALEVIERFTAARLLTVDGATVEITHEALLHEWTQLRNWIDTDRERLKFDQLVGEAASTWEREGHDPGLLLRGERLNKALAAAATAPAEGIDAPSSGRDSLQRRFLAESARKRDEEEGLQRAHEHRKRRLIWMLAITVPVILVVSGYLILLLRDRAAMRQLSEATDLAVRANADSFDRPDKAWKEAVSAYRKRDTAATRSALLSTQAQPLVARWQAGYAQAAGVSFSPDGSLAATGDLDGTLRLWRLKGRARVRSEHMPYGITAVAFGGRTSSGTALAVAYGPAVSIFQIGPDGTITSEAKHTFNVTTVLALSWDGDRRRLAVSGTGGLVATWAGGTTKPQILHGGGAKVYAVAFDPHSDLVAAGDDTGHLTLWDATTGKRAATQPPLADSGVMGVAFSPDGATLAFSLQAGQVQFFNTGTGRIEGRTAIPEGAGALAYRDDGRLLAVVSGRTAQLIDVQGHRQVFTLGGHLQGVRAVAFQPGGRLAATASDDGAVTVWRTLAPAFLPQPSASLHALAVDHTGSLIATGGDARIVYLTDPRHPDNPATPLSPHLPDGIWNVAFSPDGKRLAAVVYGHKQVWIWDVASRTLLSDARVHTDTVWCVVFDPRRHFVATAGDDQQIIIHDYAMHKVLKRLKTTPGQSKGNIEALNVSDDGRWLAAAEYGGTVHVYRTSDWQEEYRFQDGRSVIHRLAFNPAGTLLAIASTDGSIRLWDRRSNKLTRALPSGHNSAVNGLAFSKDGLHLAGSGDDRTIRIWDMRHRRFELALSGIPEAIDSVAFTPDDHLISASNDGVLRLWTISPTDLLHHPLQAIGAEQNGNPH
ncbi:helix-turn-helix domain-containing protein [Actinomadura sp. LD22]|uniref:Helix-turn-helix domain-containing protein n=1 Tax=Actinomadura physcomitrii TaxID=2650748 RepID=A0A6I4M4E2_9ACTN|nr:helix-turn-helix domain-containing protein [Actinomadura physcomitrii]MVZ99036.1 helix-turn-helix domain-containing protein [Actinomadura physcomitrii]